MGRPGLEPDDTSAPIVADRCTEDAFQATRNDVKARAISALPGPGGSIEEALVAALYRAAQAGRFDAVAQLARELEARRLSIVVNVVPLDAKRPRSG